MVVESHTIFAEDQIPCPFSKSMLELIQYSLVSYVFYDHDLISDDNVPWSCMKNTLDKCILVCSYNSEIYSSFPVDRRDIGM